MTQIELFNAEGHLIAHEAIKPYETGKRLSVWAANAQRKLDKLIAANPDASTATIGAHKFVVTDGRSSATPADRSI